MLVEYFTYKDVFFHPFSIFAAEGHDNIRIQSVMEVLALG